MNILFRVINSSYVYMYVYLDIDLEHDYILLHTKDVQMTHPKYSSFAGIMTEVRKILFIMHDINAKPLLWDMNC